MTTWGSFKQTVSDLILKDIDGKKWSDEALLALYEWACNALCQHTPFPKVQDYGEATETTYPLPSDIYGDLLDGCVLYLTGPTGRNELVYPPNVPVPPSQRGFEVEGDQIVLKESPGPNCTLHLAYFATYPMPVADPSTLSTPAWATNALSYFIGAYALTSRVTSFSLTNQWKVKEESGTPLHNPALALQKWYLELAQGELTRHLPINRMRYWKDRIRIG